MNRRRFLQYLGAGSSLVPFAAEGAGKKPKCDFPALPRERLAVASYPFRKDLKAGTGTMKLLDFPEMVADRFHVHGIEPLDSHFESMDPAYLEQFRQSLAKAKSHVVNIPVGAVHGSFYDTDAAHREAAIGSARKWTDVAAAIGSPSIRAHIRGVRGMTPDVERAAASLREVAAYGRTKNIVVNLENDDPGTEDAFFIVDIIQRARSPWLRALPDFCNSMLLNHGIEYNDRSVSAMFRHACNICHCKEIETADGKLFRVELPKLVAIAQKCRYRGYFSMEWDSDGDPYSGTEHLIALTLSALG